MQNYLCLCAQKRAYPCPTHAHRYHALDQQVNHENKMRLDTIKFTCAKNGKLVLQIFSPYPSNSATIER
jgi:hypothetical protein